MNPAQDPFGQVRFDRLSRTELDGFVFVVIVKVRQTSDQANSEGSDVEARGCNVQQFSNEILFIIYHHLGFQFNCAVRRECAD